MKYSKDMKQVTCRDCGKHYHKRILDVENADYKNMQCYECYRAAKQ